MKDVRIVIVSWNVEKLLERCLRSLLRACEGLDWEVVVVDNNSHDGSVALARRFADASTGRMTVIANQDNRGFARACNQGITSHDARYILLLNPDTECPALSLMQLVRHADQKPKAGIIGPKITYPDGRYQQSARRFPTVWSQAGILLKLHHLVRWLPTFRRYFMDDLESDREQTIDQVMGACFLIRREVIEQIGCLDERYFIWFEEVDYCRMAKEKGWEVLYVPSFSIIHHGRQSFTQVFSAKKQQMFNESLLKYFKKWHPGWRAMLLELLDPISQNLTRTIDIRNRTERQWVYWLFGILFFESFSFAFVFWPTHRAVVSVILGIAMLFLARRRPNVAIVVLLLELAIGSKGALLKIPHGWDVDGGTSLRIVLMAGFFTGWITNSIIYWLDKRRQLADFIRELLRESSPWFALALLVIWGIFRGWQRHNPKLMDDANAWFYLLLLLPVWCICRRYQKNVVRHAGQAMIAALLWLPIKTLGLLYVFSHGLKQYSQPLYLWVRRTGVGEVTLVTGNLFRIFIQSQVYAVAGFLFASSGMLYKEKHNLPIPLWVFITASSVSLAVGLSRSLWIGLFCGCLALFILFLIQIRTHGNDADGTFRWVEIGRRIGLIAVFIVVAFGFILATVSFPYPRVDVGSLKTLFGSRGSTTDAAAESRWNLLPVLVSKIKEAPILGSGFGATVTYESRDPRILAKSPDGAYTTYAFEWGWLEHWIKFGILGIPIMAWLLVNLMRRVWKTDEPLWIRAGFVSSLIALATLHVFTPYLNHPLGFGFLLAAEGWIIASRRFP